MRLRFREWAGETTGSGRLTSCVSCQIHRHGYNADSFSCFYQYAAYCRYQIETLKQGPDVTRDSADSN